MPLFGHNNATTGTGNTGNATGHHGHTGPGPVIGAAAGGLAGHHEGHTTGGAALGAAAGQHHAHKHPDNTVPSGVNNMPNAPGATTHQGGAQIPAAGVAGSGMGNGTGQAGGGAGEKAFVGKLEHAAGTVLCSSTLKAKGLEKEREAQALKVQAAEIGAAERLEGEASSRRERAVAHGAHPHHLGGGAGGPTGAGTGTHAHGAPVGDTYGGGIPPTGPAGGAPNAGAMGTGGGIGGAGGLGPQGAAGLR